MTGSASRAAAVREQRFSAVTFFRHSPCPESASTSSIRFLDFVRHDHAIRNFPSRHMFDHCAIADGMAGLLLRYRLRRPQDRLGDPAPVRSTFAPDAPRFFPMAYYVPCSALVPLRRNMHWMRARSRANRICAQCSNPAGDASDPITEPAVNAF
jgi:hypothetical protein